MNIGEKIKQLRLEKSYSLQQLADLAGLSKPAIQQYEDNTINPSNKALQAIARVLGVGLWSFFANKKTNLELADFRLGDTLSDVDKERKIIHRDIVDNSQSYIELEGILNEKIVFDNPIADLIINNYDDVEKAVIKLRKKWKLNDNPIDDVTGFLENKGIKIITVDRPTQSPGLCGRIKDGEQLIPIIIININQEHTREVTRKRFTILHELAHLVLILGDTVDKQLAEKLCNRFASAFLLPDAALKEYLGKDRTTISLEELKIIKQVYGISIQGIIYRAHNVGLISWEQCEKWGNQYETWRASEASLGNYSKSDETPSRFRRLLTKALAEKKISREKAAELLNMKIDEVEMQFINKSFDLN
jgi:Zn-dependent peptidase ImmA (M78 family)/DNA-binding XRE family transcriptional regulator